MAEAAIAQTRQRMASADRREQILRCATQLFERFSYDDVSTADIAAAAGIGRPLINHYFGTKRELYLEVVRRMSFVPAFAAKKIAAGPLEERVDHSIDRWLTNISRHRNMWLATISSPGPGRDREIEAIMNQADEVATDRMLEALGLEHHIAPGDKLRAMVLAYGGLAKSAGRQWLVSGSLSREETRHLLTRTLLTIIRDVAPSA